MVDIIAWSQLSWHNFFPTEIIKQLKVPYMVITGENAFTRPGAEEMYKNAVVEKELHIVKGASHFEMYDFEDYLNKNVGHIVSFLEKHVSRR